MNNIADFLSRNDQYLLLTHRRPDGDTLGSAVALCAGLRSMGKTAYLWRNPDITPRYMPYAEPYFAPDNYAYKVAAAVDIASASLLGTGWSAPVHLRIDHHPGTSGFAGLEYTDPSAAACGEIVLELLQLLNVPITKELAVPLYIALTTDTNCFRNANTTARSHRIAALLMEAGADAHELDAALFSKTGSRLAAESMIISGIAYFAGGRAAVGSLSLAQKNSAGATEDDLDSIAALLHQIAGVEAGLLLREEKNEWRISCRTKAPYAANRICAVLGGGGHERAAGANLSQPLNPDQARQKVLEALRESYPELRD